MMHSMLDWPRDSMMLDDVAAVQGGGKNNLGSVS